MKLIPVALLGILFICCSNDVTIQQIDQEVATLTTIEKQTKFLEHILAKDQEVRHFETEQLQKFGYDSKEHQLAVQNWWKTDDLNLFKIEAYLKTYGYPTIKEHGKEAVRAPWLVIHHAPGDVEPRKRNFKYLYEGFKQGDLEADQLTFFLNRMYDKKFGYRIEWNRPYKTEEELDTLFKSLDLLEIVREVDQKITSNFDLN